MVVVGRYRRVAMCLAVDIGDNGSGEWDGYATMAAEGGRRVQWVRVAA